MKELICDAFCASLEVTKVPIGYAVSTPYENADGDKLLLYFIRDERNRWRIEDDGTQVPWLEAIGVDLSARGPRGEAFEALLDEYGALYNKDACTIFSGPLDDAEIGGAAVRFVALLLRLQDLALLAPQIIRNTFRADAIAAIHLEFDGAANVGEQERFSPELAGQEADVVIRAKSAPPLAIFIGTQEERALQALVLKMETEKYRQIDGSVVLLVERAKSNPIRESTLSLSMARLDAVVSFRESTRETMDKLRRLARVNGHLRMPQ